MKRLPLPLLAGLLAVVVLSSSLAYWGLQWFRPAQRPLAALAPAAAQAPAPDAGATLFGGQVVTAVASNYQLKGVVAANRSQDAVAIIAVDGKAPAAYKVGKEIQPGVTVAEVHARHVMLAEGPTRKRLDLPAEAPASGVQPVSPVPITPMTPPPLPQAPPTTVNPSPSMMMMPTPQSGSGNTPVNK